MQAMILKGISQIVAGSHPLTPVDLPIPEPDKDQLLIRVSACGVCRTELDEIEGRTPPPGFPVIPGHQVVGYVEAVGAGVRQFKRGDRIGVGWIYSACGRCRFCREGNENLCLSFAATGRDVDGGYAEYMAARADFVYMIPDVFSDTEAAPLLCAGAIGYRSLRLSGIQNGRPLGLTGFGASAHLVLKTARQLYPDTRIYVFARNENERNFALELGAVWAGDTADTAPEKLRAIIDTTPAWRPVVEALKNLERGGRLVINAIRKEEADREALLELDYASRLWMEKEIKSVANVTRFDIEEFLQLAAATDIKPSIREYPLQEANMALTDLKTGRLHGAKVLRMD